MSRGFTAALQALPLGSFFGVANGRSYIVTRRLVAAGRGEKLVAEAVDGSDYISLNLYHLTSGDILKPCEMPAKKVIDFVFALVPSEQTKA